jgi:mycothiol maleylpyruvate isomerase-like protein
LSIEEDAMGAKAEALAKQFEAKAQEATAVLEKLSDAAWKKVTESEKWTVGVTAHHLAGAHEPIANIVKTIASGQSMPNFTLDMLHEANAKHAKEHAGCTKAETLALHKKGATAAATVVRGLSDDQLAASGTVLAGMPAMSTEQVVKNILINHIDDHLSSIKKTISA